MTDDARPPLPPFDFASATVKVRKAEDAWNSRNPTKVALAYTHDSLWRNRDEIFRGRETIVAFLTRKWATETDYRLIKELWGFRENRIAVRFCYEWHTEVVGDKDAAWFRSYGNELWEFNDDGLMGVRHASINDITIAESDRRFHWQLGYPRPDDHPGLSELGI